MRMDAGCVVGVSIAIVDCSNNLPNSCSDNLSSHAPSTGYGRDDCPWAELFVEKVVKLLPCT